MNPVQARACVAAVDEILGEDSPYTEYESDALAEEMVAHARPAADEQYRGVVLSCSTCRTRWFTRSGVKPR